ncbi:hypothetical protein [Spongiibacter marinus]|uniref:hypothetical protein n=1 Tax=Spongiibacter marinus TaxID=354246 RepID=UPI001961A69A|nr:hypothetical protein [Spongiibacter marinus]MBM7423822.1 hypothetical protein [Spongiibacter marinus]
MIVYQHDAAGLYQGETEADESPLETGKFLLPARCTETPPPPEVPEGKWPRWNGHSWDLVNRPAQSEPEDPVAKLQAFLQQNPDVAQLISQ